MQGGYEERRATDDTAETAGHQTPRWRVIFLFITIAIVIGAFAYFFAQKAFPGSGYIPNRISVTVYVRRTPARLRMRAFINEADPGKDLIEGTVIGPGGKVDPTLLVIQCSTGSKYFREHEKKLFSETAEGWTSAGVIVKSYTRDTWKSFVDCFAPPKNKSARYRPSGPPSAAIVNIAPPVLEANLAAQLSQAPTSLYAEENHGQVIRVFEVTHAPSSNCPTPPTSSRSPTLQPSKVTSGQAAPSISRASQNAAPTSSTTTPLCFPFYIPKSVKTTEKVLNINLSGYRIESMFPSGLINRTSNVVWQGHANLGPTLIATNLASERRDNQYTFLSGILAGLAISVILTVIQGLVSFKKEPV
jgi:hypothetical protein